MRHSECSCTGECEDHDVSGHGMHGDSGESSLCRSGGSERYGSAEACKDDCVAGTTASIGSSPVHTGHARTDRKTHVHTEQDSSIASSTEQQGDGMGHWSSEDGARPAAARGANASLLNEAPFQSRHSAHNRNAMPCASPDRSDCMQKEDTQTQQAEAGALGPSSSTAVRTHVTDAACTGEPGNSGNAASIIEVSQKIEQMAVSLMARQAALGDCSKHSERGTACKSSEETHTGPAEREMVIGGGHASAKTTHVPAGFAVSKTQYKIFFTSEDAKNADADTSVRTVTFPQYGSGSLEKTQQKKTGHTVPRLYTHSQMPSMCAGHAAAYDSAAKDPGAVHLVRTKHKDTILVDCTAPQYTGPSAVHRSAHAVDTRRPLYEDATSYEDSLCDLVERLSTKNNIEDVCVPIQREIHYVDPEVAAKDRRREKKGLFCRFFSSVFGCCA